MKVGAARYKSPPAGESWGSHWYRRAVRGEEIPELSDRDLGPIVRFVARHYATENGLPIPKRLEAKPIEGGMRRR